MKHALPAFSCDTEEEAKSLVILRCKLGYQGRYIWPNFGGELDDLAKVSEILASDYVKLKKSTKKGDKS